jgi:hypothetical protein
MIMAECRGMYRSLYRSRRANLTITAGHQAKTKIMCRRLPAKFTMLRR